MSAEAEALRAVIAAARKWAHANGMDQVEDTNDELQDAITVLEEVFKTPAYEEDFVAWMDTRAGDLVQAPGGDWFEIVSSVQGDAEDTQKVSLRIGERTGTYIRLAEVRVTVRRPKNAMNEAIDLLAETFGPIRAMDWS